MTLRPIITAFLFISVLSSLLAQPNWDAIKTSVSFTIHDTSFQTPQLMPHSVGGWEDGLYITRDGKHLYSTFVPVDITSWLGDFQPCIDFDPYLRTPIIGVDTVTNPWGCTNYMQSDIIIADRTDTAGDFSAWQPSNLSNPVTFDGGVCGVLKNETTFDVFVFTKDTGSTGADIYLLSDVSVDPSMKGARPILVTNAHEDNPHIERLADNSLLLFFDRDRWIYYSTSTDDGVTWTTPVQITSVLNDQAPFDVQPHLWNDGTDWWVYFCATNDNGIRCIYKSKQLVAGDWNKWGAKELVVEPNFIIPGGLGYIYGIGEPSLTQWGVLSFVAVYGNHQTTDTTDVYDCDPWMLKRKHPIVQAPVVVLSTNEADNDMGLYPNPAQAVLHLDCPCMNGEITIFNALGIPAMRFPFVKSTQQMAINIQSLAPGMYSISSDCIANKRAVFVKE